MILVLLELPYDMAVVMVIIRHRTEETFFVVSLVTFLRSWNVFVACL